jgi:hypothetical protein
MRFVAACVVLTVALLSVPSGADAWGAYGHRLVSSTAARAFGPDLPAFLRTPAAAAEIEALGPEMDRLKGSGKEWDGAEDPGHYIDLDDAGGIGGVVSLAALPATREDYDSALRKANTDQYKMGFLPYDLVGGYEQLVTDFALWRIDTVGAAQAKTESDRAYFVADRALRETLTIRDLGVWSHFVGDASQPLHASIHFNGWGSGPNPKNYSNSQTIHARFETTLVDAAATPELIAKRIKPFVPCTCTIEAYVARYLGATLAAVPAVYDLEAAGGIDGKSPQAVGLMLDRIAAGAQALRDLTSEAWIASGSRTFGRERTSVLDFEAGKAVPSKRAFGGD